MPSAGARKLNEILSGGPKAVEMTLADQRAAGEHQEDLSSEPTGVRYEDVVALDGYWAIPEAGAAENKALVYLYGGGYVISSPASRHKMAGHLAAAAGVRVLVPRYRLAPEHPYPAAVDDASAAIRWLGENGYDSRDVVVAGDSSAGGLALATLLRERDAGNQLAGAVALSPWTDLACTGESLSDSRDLSVTADALARMARQYLGDHDAHDPLASPLYGELHDLPPILIVTGGDEALLDDSVRFARKAGRAGTDVTLRIGAGMQHIYPVYAGLMPEADEAIAEIARWLRARLDLDARDG